MIKSIYIKISTCVSLLILAGDVIAQTPQNRSTADSLKKQSEPTTESSVKNLDGVEVKARRELFQIDNNVIKVQVSGAPVLSAGMLYDALGKIPHVDIDPITKTIGIDGKPGIQLYVDNRHIQLTADQLSKYLQSLPASSIDRIEVYLSPPARFDAAGGGVVQVFTKRSESEGVFLDASLTPGVGRYGKLMGSLLLTFRKKNWYTYAMYNPQLRSTYFTYNVEQQLQPGSTNGEQFRRVDTQQHGLRIATEWTVTKALTIGATVYGFNSRDLTTIHSQNQQILPTQTDHVQAQSSFDNYLKNGLANLNVRKRLKALTMSVDLDAARYSDEASTKATYQRNDDQPNQLQSFFPVAIALQSIKADVSQALSTNATLEAGGRISHSSIEVIPTLISYSPAFSGLVDNLVQTFSYRETIRAIYGQYQKKFKQNNSLQVGLRLESTHLETTTNGSTAQRTYNNWFPSATYQKQFGNKATMIITYNRRIIRPNFNALNPVYLFYDPFTIVKGNPQLIPQLSSTGQITYQLANRHQVTVSYLQSQQRITDVVYRQDSLSPILYSTLINFKKEQRLSGTYSFPLQLSKTWKMQTNLTVNYQRYENPANGTPFSIQATSVTLNNYHMLTIGKWVADMQILGRTPTSLGYMRYKPLLSINMGVSRSLWAGKGSIKIAGTDVFHTVTIANYGQYGFTHVSFRHRYETQTFLLTLSYRLGNEKLKGTKIRETATEAEQERLKK